MLRCAQVTLELPQAQRGSFVFLCLGFLAEPHRVVGDELGLRCFVHAPSQEQVDAPDASGSESLASQSVVEIRDRLLRQIRESHTSDAGEDVAVNQIAVPALGVAIPLVPIGGEPLVAPLTNREIIFFLHIIASFLANEQYHRKQEIATGKNGIFAEQNYSK